MLSRRLTVAIPTTGGSASAGQGHGQARSDEAVLGVATASGGVVYSDGAVLVYGSKSTVSSPAVIPAVPGSSGGLGRLLWVPIGGLGG